jgi:protease II
MLDRPPNLEFPSTRKDATPTRAALGRATLVGTRCALIAGLFLGCRGASLPHRDSAHTRDNPLAYPKTPRGPEVSSHFGVHVEDPYRWLETNEDDFYRYSASENGSKLWYSTEAAFDRTAFVTERIFYSSRDGTRVPIFIIRRRDVSLSPDTPLLLTGYGGFREVNRPLYRPDIVAWVESGGIYAIACIRGGGEYGETWHREGMLHNKQNVFGDFMAAADWLVERNYTSRRHLVLGGASNGGLLVAAVIAQRPDIAAAALIGEPAGRWFDFLGSARVGWPNTATPRSKRTFGRSSPTRPTIT